MPGWSVDIGVGVDSVKGWCINYLIENITKYGRAEIQFYTKKNPKMLNSRCNPRGHFKIQPYE